MIVIPQVAFNSQQVALGEELPPVRRVRELVRQGAGEISILDLDGELAVDVLPQWVQALIAVSGVPLRFDGRLHQGSRIERLARAGFDSIIVDQTALFDPLVLRWAFDLFGQRLVVEVQADGEYVLGGPSSSFGTELVDLVSNLHFHGVRRILYRDHAAGVVPLQRLLELVDRLPGMRITYAGAVSDVEVIGELAMVGPAMEAVLLDSGLVESGNIDLSEAIRIAAIS